MSSLLQVCRFILQYICTKIPQPLNLRATNSKHAYGARLLTGGDASIEWVHLINFWLALLVRYN